MVLLLGLPRMLCAQTEFEASLSGFIPEISTQAAGLPVPVAARVQDLPEDSGETGYDWSSYDAPVVDYVSGREKKAGAPTQAPEPARSSAVGWTSYDAPRESAWSSYDAPMPYDPAIRSVSGGLPGNIAAFLDTIAYAEGTGRSYNYIFTFATFGSYRDHPRRVICSGGLCSNAAGRYQFLAETWDPLRRDLRLGDFSPLNQDKAALELIRRAGAYGLVANSSDYYSFAAALQKLNRIWASFPGSPYGQPTRTTAELWQVFRQARAIYRS